MKAGIHPEYYQVEATCVCGNVVLTGSTRSIVKMDICSACHPFYTGTQKIVDTEGRVEKFKKRLAKAEEYKKTEKKSKKKAEKQEQEQEKQPQPVAAQETSPEQPVQVTAETTSPAESTPEPDAPTAE